MQGLSAIVSGVFINIRIKDKFEEKNSLSLSACLYLLVR